MQYSKALRTLSFILGFTLVILSLLVSSCATGKNQAANAEIGLKAGAVPEGICLTFDNIPPETKRMFINIQYAVDEEMPSITNYVSSFSDLRDSSLAQVKQTGKVIFPVVEQGFKYHISVIFEGEDSKEISDWISTDCIADKGISLSNDLSLNLNEANTGVTLSSEPAFSSELFFDDVKYNFAVTIFQYQTETESGSIGVGSHHIDGIEGLTWTFDPAMTDDLRKEGHLESGSYPAYVTARCNIIYDNIKWSVEIAKTEEFVYSL
jgi:hypothetical protein